MIAIFIAGPYRYLDHMVAQIDDILEGYNYEYSYFIHSWKTDKGNKKRDIDSQNIGALVANKRAKIFISEDGVSERALNSYGYFSRPKNGPADHTPASSINATYGMFYSMRMLMSNLEGLLDSDAYTHVLRLRSDIVLLNKDLLPSLFNKQKGVYVAHNHLLGNDYMRLCDHIWYSTINDFKKIWCWRFSSIYRLHKISGRSPETTLGLMKIISIPLVRPNKIILRDVDYHVIYTPSRNYDPEWRKLIDKVRNIYLRADEVYAGSEVRELEQIHKHKMDQGRDVSLLKKVSIVLRRFI